MQNDRFRPDAALFPLMPPDMAAQFDAVVILRQSGGQIAEVMAGPGECANCGRPGPAWQPCRSCNPGLGNQAGSMVRR